MIPLPEMDEGFITVQPSPEKNLLAAVLARALNDIQGHSDKGKHRRDALKWVRCKSNEAYSFNHICGVLSLSPRVMRELAVKLTKKPNGKKTF